MWVFWLNKYDPQSKANFTITFEHTVQSKRKSEDALCHRDFVCQRISCVIKILFLSYNSLSFNNNLIVINH